MFPNLLFKSFISLDKHKIAIISEATVISKPSSLGFIFFSPERDTSTFLNALSFKSKHLFHVTFSISSSFPCQMWLSIIALKRLLAVVIAWISPVKCKFISSIGATCEYPPPVAPPLIPNTGPKEGSRNANTAFLFIL